MIIKADHVIDTVRFATEADLKRVPRLRWQLDEDRSVIAITKRMPYRQDYLYFHGPGRLGIYYQAQTSNGATARVKRYRKMLGGRIVKVLDGDIEGLIIFRANSAADIPIVFFKSRTGPTLPQTALQSRFLTAQ